MSDIYVDIMSIPCLKVLIVISSPVFGQGSSLYSKYLNRAPQIRVVGTILMSFLMTLCWTEIQTCHLPVNQRMIYVIRHSRWYNKEWYILKQQSFNRCQAEVKVMCLFNHLVTSQSHTYIRKSTNQPPFYHQLRLEEQLRYERLEVKYKMDICYQNLINYAKSAYHARDECQLAW